MSGDPIRDLVNLLEECGAVPRFWVCPRGCRGRVVWSGSDEAVCAVCGARRLDREMRLAEWRARIRRKAFTRLDRQMRGLPVG